MIKDVAAKFFFIPLLGVLIPLSTGIFSYHNHSLYEIVFGSFFYIAIMFFLWQGIVWITAAIRKNTQLRNWLSLKILLLLFLNALFSLLFTILIIEGLKKVFPNLIQQNYIFHYAFFHLAIAPVIALIYEILFLNKEQELDSKIVAQLDYERQHAELHVLKNELDPHFVFNSLNTLAPLIATDAAKAQTFTSKLAQVYKYLLLNKDREIISLGEELRFVQDYFFLLQIRYEHKLKLHIAITEASLNKTMILPFALQLLIENAIKHNQFSEEKPLIISISQNKQFIQVSNTTYIKSYGVDSANVGLKNLRARYKLTCHRDIIIYPAKDLFIVKLPLIKTTV